MFFLGGSEGYRAHGLLAASDSVTEFLMTETSQEIVCLRLLSSDHMSLDLAR